MEEAKKTERKRKRFTARLLSSKGIKCTETPGPNIILCNAGQATGLEKADVVNVIESNRLGIPLPKYISEKGESYSFLAFDNTENALVFFNKLNGITKFNKNGSIMYMNFVEKVPNTEIAYEYEYPKGLLILDDFITETEEEKLLKLFDWTSESSNLKNRQVKHYGYEFRYGSNDVDLTCPLEEKIPEKCDFLWIRLHEFGYNLGVPDQLTVNKYSPGQGIPSHVDKHSPFGDTILSLSLGSDVVMDWKHHIGTYVPVVVHARSLLIMQDEARYAWRHGIQPRTHDPLIVDRLGRDQHKRVRVVTGESVPRRTRVSLTFRWTQRAPCRCVHRALCDTRAHSSLHLEDTIAADIERLHVHQVYEQIAGHFSSTRHKPWPKVVQFMGDVPPGSVVYDLGAGNGKNILSRCDIVQIAVERSRALCGECRVHAVAGADCVHADLLHAPLRGASADVVICIAVVHHFSNKARRLEAISCIHRLLRKGGRAMITVWAKDQTRSNYLKPKEDPNYTNDVIEDRVKVGSISLPVHENRTQFKHNDLLVPWKLRNMTGDKLSDKPEDTLLRYYHVFEENELDELCIQVGFEIESSFYEEGNWCVVCEKK